MTRRARSTDGTEIAFDLYGDGPALVLVGGALSDRSAGADLAGRLAPSFTVYAYDRRGRGDSGDTPPYAVDREIEDLGAVINEAGGSAFVYGHSSGAVLALRAAAAGLPIARLIVYEPPFIVDGSRSPLPDDYFATLDRLIAEGRRGDAVEYFMRVGVGVPASTLEDMRSGPMWPSLEVSAHTLGYDGRIVGDTMSGRPLVAEEWSGVTMPTLALNDGASPPWQRNTVHALAEILPDVRQVTLEGQGHGAAAQVLAPILFRFFLDTGR